MASSVVRLSAERHQHRVASLGRRRPSPQLRVAAPAGICHEQAVELAAAWSVELTEPLEGPLVRAFSCPRNQPDHPIDRSTRSGTRPTQSRSTDKPPARASRSQDAGP